MTGSRSAPADHPAERPAGHPADGPDAVAAVADFARAVAAARAAGRGVLVAVDFDGTLAPIVRDPTTSRPVAGATAALADLAAGGTSVAVVTGREARVVVELGGLEAVPGITVDGVYGAQRLRGGELTLAPVPDTMRAARAEVTAVLAAATTDPDVWVEDKDVSFVVHARMSARPDEVMAALEAPVRELADRHRLELHPGKQVLELRVPGIDKGSALDALLDELDPAAVLWAGDDLGDVPAFDAVDRWRAAAPGRAALTVAVAPAGDSPDPLGGDDAGADALDPALASRADVVVTGPAQVVELLRRLV